MQRVWIPDTSLNVSRLCLGTGVFGARIKGDNATQVVEEYLRLGGNFLDTAHCYAFWEPEGEAGCSERELGRILRDLGVREQVVLATKGAHPDGGPKYPRPARYLSPEVMTQDIAESLQRLQVDTIDLYYLHRDDSRVPVDEIVDALNEHIRAGHIRYLGASNWRTERIEQANRYAAQRGLQGFVISQVQWSLAAPNWQMGEDPTVRYVTPEDAEWYAQAGIPIAAYTSTAQGYFAGTSKGEEQFGHNPVNAARRERALQLAQQLGVTPTQVALAWLLHQKPLTIPIFMTGNLQHLRECMSAAEVRLTPEQVRWLVEGD
ncbi:MAG: aldo/keto reductase [Armatimonadota bacterium]|nr:MAG: aldo/keto reductase [Armatimonadota bacterium]